MTPAPTTPRTRKTALLVAAPLLLALAAPPALAQLVVPGTTTTTKNGVEGAQWIREAGTLKAGTPPVIPMNCGELGMPGNMPVGTPDKTSAEKPCFRIENNWGSGTYRVISVDDSCLAPVSPMVATVTLSDDRVVAYSIRDDDRWWRCDGTEVPSP